MGVVLSCWFYSASSGLFCLEGVRLNRRMFVEGGAGVSVYVVRG